MGSDPSFAGEGSLSRGPLLAGPMLGEVGETFARVWFQARDTSPLTLTLHAPAGDLAYELTPSEEDWLCERLKASTAPVKLLVSGSQMLPEAAATLGWECWRRDAPGELERLVSFLSQHDIRGVVLASGDVHLGYLLHEQGRSLPGGRVGPELWELTSSPLANDTWTETVARLGRPDRFIVREIESLNYGIIDVDLDRAGQEIRLVLKDEQGGVLVNQPLALDQLRVRPATT